ncbi:hypothetical protein AVEN_20706-1 [Araneus ventricosus]|uniref:Uncharacterized protein n=1 Tax=Araneus ventricosus TaxID=182803 RepID=A0A4Y2HT15_ARAVE|nr:hypothetical protein AVEN_20706-1 [Araneus ventricosus]
MANLQKYLYETSGRMFVLVLLIFVVCKATAYDISSSSDESSSSDIDEVKRFSPGDAVAYYKRYGLTEDMAKRALSLLAHWKPQFVGMPKINTRSDIVSAVTRGGGHSRPLGQPLRWG